MENTPGKGPFSRRSSAGSVGAYGVRWYAPHAFLTRDSARNLIKFISARRGDSAFYLFGSLATTTPPYRLARNLGVLLRQSAVRTVTDALQDGMSAQESGALADLERWGVPLDLLSVAHALLNVKERQMVLSEGIVVLFEAARADDVVLTTDEVNTLRKS